MATKNTRARATRAAGRAPAAGPDPDGGHGEVHDQLIAAVAETARLLDADGAMVYLIDPETGHLRFAHDSGIRSKRSRAWVRSIVLPVGVGMFGRAVEAGGVVSTDDYLADQTIAHASDPDRVVADIGIRSMVAAPLISGDQVFGALGAFSSRVGAFDQQQIRLVRALADHAAAAMANARLIEALDRSREELAKQADIERSLREIAARISASVDLPAVLQRAVDEAARLLSADGARIDLIDPTTGLLRWAYASGGGRPGPLEWPDDPDERLEEGVSGKAITTGRPAWTGDYLVDPGFIHGYGGDTYVSNVGIKSVLAAPLLGESGPFGAVTTYSNRVDAWGERDAELLVAIADQAAITITTTRLMEESATAREALSRRAAAEQALREIAARITVLRDPAEILQDVVYHAGRLVGADGVILDLLDPATGNLHWKYDDGLGSLFTEEERSKLWISIGVGATGTSVAEARVVVAGDDLAAQFPPSPESTEFYERTGFHSMIAAPITGEHGPLGVLEVYSKERDAFTETDGSLMGALASQAAIAITNARLVDELARSQTDLAQAADAERTLREIGARVGAMHDQEEILQSVIEAVARLLRASGVTIDLMDRDRMAEIWIPGVLVGQGAGEKLLKDIDVDPESGISGVAVRDRMAVWTNDYLVDDRFIHTEDRDDFVRQTGTRSVIAAPLVHGDEVLGVVNAYADRTDAFDADDAAILTGLADQAAVTIANARLIDDLERSRAEIARRGDAERTLREIAARVSAILDPAEVLQRIVDEAARLLDSDGARIDQYDPEIDALRWSYSAGSAMSKRPDWAVTGGLRPGHAVAGLAFAEQRPVLTVDYLADDRFDHQVEVDDFIRDAGIRAVMSTPLSGAVGPLGTISVVSRSIGAYDESDLEILTALATQASIAIRNAHLIEELERSRSAEARRAETERSLRHITAEIASLREPGIVLERVVDEAKRLLGADGAHLTRMSEDRTYLVPVVIAGGSDPDTKAWLMGMEFPIGGGINGLAAERRQPVSTADYLTDDRIPQEDEDVEVAQRLGLRGMAAAPLRAPGGEVIGTLAISSATPREYAVDELDLLQGLADQAAIAITNSTLLARLTASEERYRYLVESAPDLIWSIGTDSRLTFLSDAVERMLGRQAKDLLGQHFGVLLHESSGDVAELDWTEGLATGSQQLRGRLNLLGPDGEPIPAEFIATARLNEDGTFAGANGSVRDMRDRDRLERELQESEHRFRQLVQTTPDVIYRCDADGRFTFMAEGAEALFGWAPAEVIGLGFADLTAEESLPEAKRNFEAQREEHDVVRRFRYLLRHRDGTTFPGDISSVAVWEDGRFAGVQGTVRSMSEQERLERELHRSEERYRFLVENSPDVVFAADAEGRFTFLSEAIESMTGFAPAELVGQHFSVVVSEDTLATAADRWARLVADPATQQVAELMLTGRDGRMTPVEVHSLGIRDEQGRFAGIHGATRDISERQRLNRELRRQAGELAASDERAHLARELHDSVTQALFSMTLVTRSAELLLDRDPEAARAQLAQLRDLQREALAEMRALIFELRPGNLEQDGLIRALKTHTAALQGRIGLPVVVESSLDERLPLPVEETLYRIAQEALHNVVKHASARQVRVEVGRLRDGVRLRIVDDGRGFDPSSVPAGHLGLAGMASRAGRIGATFTCHSAVGRGTTIEVIVPAEVCETASEESGGPAPAPAISIRDR